ncbi:MAG: hypothetical protein ACI4JS_07795 [Oscillospiraceae bacterium]
MTEEKFSKLNQFEIRLYRLVGVTAFRKIVLYVERLVHFKDRGRNSNYHPKKMSIPAIERFNCFLVFNSTLHILSLLLTVFVYFVSCRTDSHSLLIYIVSALLVLINLYCVMLQRFNFLMLKKFRQKEWKKINRNTKHRVNLMKEQGRHLLDTYSDADRGQDLRLIERLHNCFYKEVDCVIGVGDIPSLERMASLISLTVSDSPKKCPGGNGATKISELIGDARRDFSIYSDTGRRASTLMKLFGYRGRQVYGRICLVTENSDCESLFKQIFPVDSVECWFSTLNALKQIIEKRD